MPMGDATPTPGSADEFSVAASGGRHIDSQGQTAFSQQGSEPALAAQFQHQLYGNSHQNPYQQQQHHAFASQYDMTTQAHVPGRGQPGHYNMSSMMHSLPQAGFRLGQQRFSPPAPGVGAQPMPQMSPYMGPSPMSPMPGHGPPYYMAQHGHMQAYYGPPPPASQHQHQQQQQHPQQDGMAARANTAYYPQQHVQPQFYYHHGGQFAAHAPIIHNPRASGQYPQLAPQQSDARVTRNRNGEQGNGTKSHQSSAQGEGAEPEARSSVVRGPPRKPRQSGHAIWIGNLPPQTDLMNLVYHVCKEAPGLESLFLISKSNCAFANYKDEPACVMAQQKIHDSKFQSVRLVSRLRKSTVEGVSGITAPTGPSAATPQSLASQDKMGDVSSLDTPVAAATLSPDSSNADVMVSTPLTSPEITGPVPVTGSTSPTQKDKYFILKSLTVEDLEQSVKTGIWATQSHNEKALNNAFQVAESVFLIFSANKSGEYFGYARMTSQINEDPAAAIEFAPKSQSVTDAGLPKAIPTEANDFMPKGSIMDDSERGTIFWEAETDEDTEDEEFGEGREPTGDDSASIKNAGVEPGEAKAWGKPFHLEWMSTSRLPFYRTRGLRNPWNSNKEIKIARDGTELEPSVGRKLTGLFSPRAQSPVAAVAGLGARQHQIRMVSGYPPARPVYQH